jgi:hypothetical protein
MKYKIKAPPKIQEVITPEEFAVDLELVGRVVDEKMMRVYITILFICTVIMGIVVIF